MLPTLLRRQVERLMLGLKRRLGQCEVTAAALLMAGVGQGGAACCRRQAAGAGQFSPRVACKTSTPHGPTRERGVSSKAALTLDTSLVALDPAPPRWWPPTEPRPGLARLGTREEPRPARRNPSSRPTKSTRLIPRGRCIKRRLRRRMVTGSGKNAALEVPGGLEQGWTEVVFGRLQSGVNALLPED